MNFRKLLVVIAIAGFMTACGKSEGASKNSTTEITKAKISHPKGADGKINLGAVVSDIFCDKIISKADVKALAKTDQEIHTQSRVRDPKKGTRSSSEAACQWGVWEGYYRESCENVTPDNKFFWFSCVDRVLGVDFDCRPEESNEGQTAKQVVEKLASLTGAARHSIGDGAAIFTMGSSFAMEKNNCLIEIIFRPAAKFKEAWENKRNPQTDEERKHWEETVLKVAEKIDTVF